MSSFNAESTTIPPELEAEMTPAVLGFVLTLLTSQSNRTH